MYKEYKRLRKPFVSTKTGLSMFVYGKMKTAIIQASHIPEGESNSTLSKSGTNVAVYVTIAPLLNCNSPEYGFPALLFPCIRRNKEMVPLPIWYVHMLFNIRPMFFCLHIMGMNNVYRNVHSIHIFAIHIQTSLLGTPEIFQQ